MRSICTYVGCTKATTNNWDIRPSVAVKALSANISWIAKQICMIELILESAHQSVSNDLSQPVSNSFVIGLQILEAIHTHWDYSQM